MTQHPGIEENTTATESGVERVLGRIRGERAGPTLICVGGLHGNEPAGLQGLRRVLDGLQGPKGGFAAGTNGGSTAGTKGGSTAHVNGALAGDLVALAGNLTALSRGCRFIGRDLNRAWGNDRMSSLMENGGPLKSCPEDHEQIELLAALDEAVADARGQVYVLDIHTTSGPGGAFTTAGDTLRNRAFALSLEVPFVLGLEELVDGTMLEYMGRRGFIAALFEGGQHDEPEAVDRVEAAVWVALEAAGLIPRDVVPQVAKGRERLSREAIGQPPVLEMRHKYHIEPGSGFLMRPGYENFKPVRGGEVLGRNGGGEVRSPEAGRILMPLYQEQGDDGFFIVRSFHPAWLQVSALLRHLHLDRIIHWLPGVRRHPTRPGTLVADKHVARWFALEILHLLGFRKKTEEEDRFVVDRRGEHSTQ